MILIELVYTLITGIVKVVVNTINASFSLMVNSPVFFRC
jgi:hypothetical protein